jgi:hypothetical protein
LPLLASIFVVDPAKAHTMVVQDQTVVINIKPGSEKPEASGLRPTDVVSQFDVVKLLSENRDKLSLVEPLTLEALEVFEVRVSLGLSAWLWSRFVHLHTSVLWSRRGCLVWCSWASSYGRVSGLV